MRISSINIFDIEIIGSGNWGYKKMGAPSQQAVSVAVSAVRTAATNWDEAIGELETARLAADKAKFTNLEAGVFILAYEKYKDVPDFFVSRMAEGKLVFAEIASTLRYIADTYEAEDARNEHAIRNLY